MELTPFTPLKLLRHSDRVVKMLTGAVTYPISVEFDLSNVCPHDCPFCSFGTSQSQGYRQKNWVKFPVLRALSLMEELAEVGVKSVTFTGGGEPLVHPNAASIFEACHRHGMEFGVVTNGLALKGEARAVIAAHAKFVRISLDAGSAETHQFSHGTPNQQYHQILDNIRHTRALAGDRLTIGASYCVMDENWREIYAGARDAKEHGANYLEVRPTFPTDWRGDGWGHALAPENVDAAKVELEHAKTHLNGDGFRVIGMIDRFDSLAAPKKRYAKCHVGPLMTVIGATGEMFHCCVMRGMPGFTIGNVLDKPFKDVWMTPEHRQLMADIDVSRCPRCRYDGFNELVEGAFLKDAMHSNFL